MHEYLPERGVEATVCQGGRGLVKEAPLIDMLFRQARRPGCSLNGAFPMLKSVFRHALLSCFTLAVALLMVVPAAMAQAKKTDWKAKSAHGRSVNTQNYRGQVVMVFLSSPESRDALKPVTKDLVLRYGDNPDVAQLTIVDLRELEFYKRPFADDHIAKAQERTVKRIQKILKDNGKSPIPGLKRKLHLVSDFEGDIIKKYHHWDTQKFVSVVVLNKQGDVVGSWKTTQMKQVFEAVDASLSE